MRYLLLAHRVESEILTHSTEWIEGVVAYLARFEDELAASSELEWAEVLGSDEQADVVSPDGTVSQGWVNEPGKPLRRVWAVRVVDRARVIELATQLSAELDVEIELRECMPTSQRP